MRSRTVHCDKCHGNCVIVANLDSGKVVNSSMPLNCLHEKKCIRQKSMGVFDRQFGERIIKPLVQT